MTTTSNASPRPTVESPSRWTLPIVLVAQFVTPMSIAGTAIALPRISGDLGASPTALQWVVNGFNVAFALATLGWGAISDRVGYRLTFTVGAGLFALGSGVSAVAPALAVLDVARVVAGIGAAAILTGASSILSSSFEGKARTHAFALFGTVNGLGLALGPTMSGLLVSVAGWRGVFVMHAVVLLIAAVCSRLLPGGAAPTDGGHRRMPLLDLSLLRNREFCAMCLVPVAGSIGFVTMLTYLPSAFSGIKGMSAGTAGLTMLAMTVPVLLAPIVVARLVHAVRWITVGSVVFVSLIALIVGNLGILLLSESRTVGVVIAPMILLGLGFGLPVGLVDGHALASVPAERTGTAAGLLNFFRIGSEALFVAGYAFVLSTVVGRHLDGRVADDTAAGQPGHAEVYRTAFATTVVGLIILLVVITVAVVATRAKRPVQVLPV